MNKVSPYDAYTFRSILWHVTVELQQNVQSRQKLESQQQENKQVQKVQDGSWYSRIAAKNRQEFSGLDDDANIYKLVGPVLLKQDKAEAVLAVDGRLEFIDNEMWGVPIRAIQAPRANKDTESG